MFSSIISKVLVSSMVIASLSGGGYGISRAFNNSSTVSSNNKNQEVVVKKEKEIIYKRQDNKVLEQNIRNEEERKIDELRVIEEKESLQANQKILNSVELPKNFKREEIIKAVEIQETENKNKVIASEDEKLEIEEDSVKVEDFDLSSDKEEKKRLSEEEKGDIFLEANWMFTVGNEKPKESLCLLINQKDKQSKKILDLHEDEVDDSCGETSWYRWMEYEYQSENLWIRGNKSSINELAVANEDNWVTGSNFLIKDQKKDNSLEFNKKLCDIKEEEQDWLEIKCSSTGKQNNLSK